MSTTPDDLMKFGFIPEFIGRLPMIATLTPLDEEAMVRILTEPRNAITRQFIKMLKADGVELTFEPEALSAIAHKALERKTGARALRSVLEEVMTNVMFDVPSIKGVAKCVIKAETITDGIEPQLVTREDQLKQIREEKKAKAA
jgi:ATP-dependent Clp protease ATP-binding subunit ClpX